EDRVKRAEWLMIGLTSGIVALTLGLVVVGILQWRVMSGQLGEMKSGGVDTHDLVQAAKTQAAANVQQVGSFAAQTLTAQNLLKLTRDQFRQDERPYITMAPAGSAGSSELVASGEHAGQLAVRLSL